MVDVGTWTCPYCGYEHRAADLLRLDNDNLQCRGCGKAFPAKPDTTDYNIPFPTIFVTLLGFTICSTTVCNDRPSCHAGSGSYHTDSDCAGCVFCRRNINGVYRTPALGLGILIPSIAEYRVSANHGGAHSWRQPLSLRSVVD